MKNVISFSGGRTSAYMVYLTKQITEKTGEEFHYVYMDTGAEHPKTYDFIRNVVSHWGIELTCLRTVINPKMGIGANYKVVGLDEIGNDLQPWKDMCAKYGVPYLGGAFCTDRMKTVPYTKYCNETFGKRNYISWLGIRADEQTRLKERKGYRYLAEISDFEKQDVLDWFKTQPFDLGIEEWLGNCVFCIKKGVNKVALAMKQEPELAIEFKEMIHDESVSTTAGGTKDYALYRGKLTFEAVGEMFEEFTDKEIIDNLRQTKKLDSGSCSESCEVFGPDSGEE